MCHLGHTKMEYYIPNIKLLSVNADSLCELAGVLMSKHICMILSRPTSISFGIIISINQGVFGIIFWSPPVWEPSTHVFAPS